MARYGVALAAVAACLLVRLWLDPLLGMGTQFTVFYIGIAVVAFFCGTGPAVFAALASALAADYWLLGQSNRFDLSPGITVAQGLFLSVCGGFIFAMHRVRRAQRQVELQATQADEQRRWFQITFSSIGDGVIATGADGRITFLNPAAEAMTGWQNGDAIGQPVEDVFRLLHEDTGLPVPHPIAEVLRTGAALELPGHPTLVARNGRELAIEDSAAPIRDGDGRIIGAVIVFHDVTERRRAADALRDAENRRSAVLQASLDAIVTMNHEGRVVDFNKAAERIFGYPAEEAIGREMAELIIPERYRTPHRRGLARYLATGEGRVFDHRLELSALRRDGGEFPCELTISVIAGATPPMFTATLRDITERKQAIEALRESEEELRAMADSMPQLAWMAHPDGNIFWYNRGWFEYTGTTLEQMQGWGWQAVHDPAILPAVVDRWRDSIQTGQPFDMEFPLRGADGAFRWFLTRVNPLRDNSGKIVRWFGTNTNVDDVRRAREALEEESRVLELLNRTGTAIASKLDLQALVQTVTDAATQLSGAKFGAFFYNVVNEQGEAFTLYTLSGAPREAFQRFGLPRNTPIFNPTFRNTGVVRSGDITKDPRYGTMPPHHGMPKGHLPVCSYLAVPVVSRGGEVIGGLFFGHPEPNIFTERAERLVVGVAAQAAIAIDNARLYEAAQREIEQRRRAEAELRESEARLRIALDASALGTWEYNPKEEIVLLDARCQELFGLPGREKVDLETFFAAAHPEDRARRERMFRAALESSGPGRYEIEFRTAGNPLRWLRTAGRVFVSEPGQPVRFITAVLDITEMVKARETMAERRRELEELVAARTASLQQAIGQMEEFSYSVSHDLRAPLRAIHGYANALEQDYAEKLDEIGRGYLQRIASAALRMDRLTLDVLTYSKISRDVMRVEPLSLDKVVAETIDQYVSNEDIRRRIVVERPLLGVEAHEPMLVQAVSNLLTNALKFVRPGEAPEVRIRTEARDCQTRLWVEDNGIGIPPESQGRIWGMFERIHPKTLYEGTGIGLAIVRKAVERMGGAVGVVSDGSTGSKFWIQLPAPSSAPPPPPADRS